MKNKKGCGKMIETVGLFGQKCKVPCGYVEEGFMPDLCEDFKKKEAVLVSGEVKK